MIEEQCLPEAADSSVSVLEWMDKFQFVMKNAGADEGVEVVGVQKLEEIVHEMGDAIRLWGDMADLRAFEDADVAGSPFSGIRYELIHHGLMGFKKGFWRERIELGHQIVGGNGVQRFLDFLLSAYDTFAFEEGGNLIEIKCVAFDGQATLDRADTVGFSKVGLRFWLFEPFDTPDQPFNFPNELEDFRCDGK